MAKQREADLHVIDEQYLRKLDHNVLCENASLRVEQNLTKVIKEEVASVKQEIRKNGKGGG